MAHRLVDAYCHVVWLHGLATSTNFGHIEVSFCLIEFRAMSMHTHREDLPF
jgi:hypothetical protein